ncbi:MAG TPA: DUF433 domain-containing protein [Acetobacteraceae bacterium]|jgi:uncharacterized protein (DUF433 family)
MRIAATLSPREVSELSGAPMRVVEKAIEEHIIRARFQASRNGERAARRMLPTHAVAYAAVIHRLDLRLTAAHKKRLAQRLALLPPGEIRTARVELSPAVELDIGRLVGDAMDRAERYRVARDSTIVVDEEILGGTPVIRGTRMTVYSVLGHVQHGDTIDDILADNPDLAREALEAAVTYARTHPLMGRPGGRRPWARAA